MATVTAVPANKIAGGSFLIEERTPDEVFTPEDFTEQHLLIAQTAEEFANKEIVPNIEKMEHKDFAVTRELVRKAGELGLSGVDVPEQYGGMEMDKVTSAIIADRIAKYGGFSTTWGAHTCIGTLPIVYFGTEEQKKKYLPGLASGQTVGAYALSESSSGSDALNCRTQAKLSADGKHYLLNGEKMWITNAGFADLFIVFAKVDGEKFTAFIVERGFPGFLGGRGRAQDGNPRLFDLSAHPQRLPGSGGECARRDRQRAPHCLQRVECRPFQAGRGMRGLGAQLHRERDRLCQAAQGVREGDRGFRIDSREAGQHGRRHFHRRSHGLSHGRHDGRGHCAARPEDTKTWAQVRKVIDEYAVECSILKVWGSEFIDYVVDETVQIYGGYGFVEEYPAERNYRDVRVNRIFEGTNEINRLLITGFLLKRAMSGQLPLMAAIKKLMDEVLSGTSEESAEGPLAARAETGCDGQEDWPVRRRSCHAEIHAGDPGSAGDHGRDRQYDD